MKRSVFYAILASAALVVSAGAMTGCDKVKEAAGTVKNVVTSMADQVNNFDSNIDAQKLDEVLKNFYNGIKSGTVNETTRGQYVTAELPKQNATSEERNTAAANATVFSALEDQGMTNHFTEDYIKSFVFADGTVKSMNAAVSEAGAYVTLGYNTKLSQLFEIS